jgi:hypothetical protein
MEYLLKSKTRKKQKKNSVVNEKYQLFFFEKNLYIQYFEDKFFDIKILTLEYNLLQRLSQVYGLLLNNKHNDYK